MKKIFLLLMLSSLPLVLQGCGYTTASTLPSHLKTIYVEPLKNSVDYTSEAKRNIYFPLMEVTIRNEIINRFLFDGHLKIAKEENADLILRGELVNYERNVLRYTDNNDPLEYRIHVVINLTIIEREKDAVFLEETGFVGETTYFATGSLSKSEADAVQDAILDTAHRVVERTIENW
ncbi:MAG: hypothetical protein A2Z88_04680 [Omnitrophica WOR_2 bacterium GWA2_47_8]|nr:MAG: hypothetical protein A2Z88_04680 [Omnitrophica WOR_2 bacterium GWA2_47_8]